jgi:uncharacterized protein YqeY
MSDIVIEKPLTLAQTIAKDRITAMKARDSGVSTSLSTVLGEAKQIATKKENREPTDEEVIGVIKKTLEGIAESLKHETIDEKRFVLLAEQQLLQQYMPVQLSKAEISVIIENSGMKGLGQIMGFFKKNYLGRFDGKELAELAKGFVG